MAAVPEQIVKKMKKTKPFLKWVGGKGRQVDVLLPLILGSGNFNEYYEPFLGCGAIALELMSSRPNVQCHLSDKNEHLIHAWRNLYGDKHEDIITLLKGIDEEYLELKTVEEQQQYYYCMRDAYNRDFVWDEVRAASFIWLNRNCFQGMWRVNRGGGFNVPPRSHYTSKTRIEYGAIMEASKIMTRATPQFYSIDFEFLSPDENSFVFCDPPYIREESGKGFTSYTVDKFTLDDHVRLSKWLKNLPCKWLLTIGGEEGVVKRIYGEPLIESRISCTFSAKSQGRRQRNEYIYANFNQ